MAKKTPYGAAKAFFEQAVASETDECILWAFTGHGDGRYGCIKIDGRHRPVHRVICAQVHGPAPSDIHEAGHLCGNTRCINHRHLRWVTPKENAADKERHGTIRKGEEVAQAKLTSDDVRRIRSLRKSMTLVALAGMFGVSPSNISMICNRKGWGWLA